MAGGSGTRFWPASRDARPKQFIDALGTGKSLLQMTFDRFRNITSSDKIWIVSNEKYKDLINEQLPKLAPHQILLEPNKRNTAPCIAYAAYKIRKEDPKAVLVISPADHVVLKEEKFEKVINTAIEGATTKEALITIGIEPHRPETGYGYIQFLPDENNAVKKVKTFTEKPKLDLAIMLVESGDFLWNSGIFVWTLDAIIQAFENHDPKIASLFANGADKYFTNEEQEFIEETYSLVKSISIDYAIMEKADNVFVVPGEFGWSDLGSWNTLHEIKDKDEKGNYTEGKSMLYDCRDNFIRGNKEKLIVVQGLEGYLVADFEDVLLICKKQDSATIKNFLLDIKSNKDEKYI